MRKSGLAAALAGAALILVACGQESDDGSPTASENEALNKIAGDLDTLDTRADSLVAEDPALGNGESAENGDLLVADQNSAEANVQ